MNKTLIRYDISGLILPISDHSMKTLFVLYVFDAYYEIQRLFAE